MGYATDNPQSDFEKLQTAWKEVTATFGSVDDLLVALGLADMPMAQRYGIMFGCLVFILTVSSVIALLFLGGSFRRIAEEAENGKTIVEGGYQDRQERALLLERLLDARHYLLQRNYPNRELPKEGLNNLTTMLLNVKLPAKDGGEKKVGEERVVELEAYKQNYVVAYHKCQDKPGGDVLAGRPEARFEAYARAYAGCGDHTNRSYRRSYARLYESLCCKSHQTDDQYTELHDKSPEVIVGSSVRLEALDAPKHLAKLFDATNGEIYYEHKSYEPQEVWGFLEDGPFESAQDLLDSFVFRHLSNEAAFCIVNNITNRIIGVILLRNDDPKNLCIQIDPPIVPPSSFGSKEQLEACFLLMDRLYAHGYRRIQYSIDAKDSQMAKLADRLGFTMEGTLVKHMVIKDSSRDSTVYGMLNSDWEKGARVVLYRKLYGMAAARSDVANNQKEEELDEQNQFLAEQKEKEAEQAKEMIEKDKKH